MSIDALRWAFQQQGIKATHKFVLIALADRADANDECFPSVRQIVADTCLDKKTVCAATAALVEAGLLHKQIRYGSSVIYRLVGVPSRHSIPENGYTQKRASSIPENGSISIPENGNLTPTLTPILTPTIIVSPKGDTRDLRKRSSPVPFSEIINLYHETLCPPLPRVAKITAQREGNIRQRWREDMPGLEDWSRYFDIVSKSDFLMGKSPPRDGQAPFLASLDWICKAGNFAKIVEGKYHATNRPRGNPAEDLRSAAGRVRANIARDRAAEAAHAHGVAVDGLDVRPPLDGEFRRHR